MRVLVPLAAAALAATGLAAVSASAQTSDQRTTQIIVYGNDPCPRTTNGDIVVCARRPERERYRIPEIFRDGQRLRDGESWAARAESIEQEGETGIGSCSAVGPGGFTGCWEEMMRQYRQDRRTNPQPRR